MSTETKKPGSLSELITYVGDANILVQPVSQFLRAEHKKKTGDVEITFATKETTVDELMGRRPRKLGLIVWLPVELLPPHMQARLTEATP